MQTNSRMDSVTLWVVMLVIVSASALAKADPMDLTFTFFPNPVVVQEFAPGAVSVTVSNPNAFAVQITCIDNIGCSDGIPPSLTFFFTGDRNDEAFNPKDDVSNCQLNGKFLGLGASGGKCNYTINFSTRDLNIPQSGTNFGVWRLLTSVDFADPPNPDVRSVGKGFVFVTDPGATIPEPSSLALLCGGIAGIVGLRRREHF